MASARELVVQAASLADIHRGGGEVLESLAPLPSRTVALEAWPPDVYLKLASALLRWASRCSAWTTEENGFRLEMKLSSWSLIAMAVL